MSRSRQVPVSLSKRERQIIDILYRATRATAAEIHAQMPDAPTYTTVRGLLRVLESKGHIAHEQDGVRYVYFPVTPKTQAGSSMLAHVVRTFFDGSPSRAMASLLGTTRALTDDELSRLSEIVDGARKERQK